MGWVEVDIGFPSEKRSGFVHFHWLVLERRSRRSPRVKKEKSDTPYKVEIPKADDSGDEHDDTLVY